MAKIQEAITRFTKNKFICKNCKTTIRADPLKIIAKKVQCRSCGQKSMRTPRKR